MSKEPPLVIVDWVDAVGRSAWFTLATVQEVVPSPVRSVGFLLREGKDDILIAASHSPGTANSEEVVSEVLTIPKDWVQKIQVVPMDKLKRYRRPKPRGT